MRLRLRPLTVLLCCCLLSACEAAVPEGEPVTSEAGSDLGLPPCGKPPSEDPTRPPPGAILPPTARLTAVREEPPLVQLNGYVESTPAAVREWIEAQSNLDVVSVEDDGDEIELLVRDNTWQTFVRVSAVCAEGSLLAEVIADCSRRSERTPHAGAAFSPDTYSHGGC